MAKPYIITWRDAVLSETGPSSPTTRLVLLTLAARMDETGRECYPSTARIARESALSERSVCTHLDKAAAEGWITRQIRGAGGQGWKRLEYRATMPKALKEVQRVGAERRSVRSGKGTEPLSKKALKEVQSNIPVEYPNTTTSLFDEAWKAYPKRPNNSKAAARRAWAARVKAGEDESQMLEGTRRYAAYIEAEKTEPRFVKLASTFFGPDEHYANDFAAAEPAKPDLLDYYANEDLR